MSKGWRKNEKVKQSFFWGSTNPNGLGGLLLSSVLSELRSRGDPWFPHILPSKGAGRFSSPTREGLVGDTYLS